MPIAHLKSVQRLLQFCIWRTFRMLRCAAAQAAQPTAGGSVHSDDGSAHRDANGAASNGKDAEATGPPTPQLDDLFREGTAWSEGRLPEVRKLAAG